MKPILRTILIIASLILLIDFAVGLFTKKEDCKKLYEISIKSPLVYFGFFGTVCGCDIRHGILK